MPEDFRKNARSGLNLSDLNARMADEITFGSLGQLDSGRMVAKPIDLDLILPDLVQPRRALPAALSYRGVGIDHLLSEWWGLAEEEAGAAIDSLVHIKGEETERSKEGAKHEPDHIEKSWMELLELAASIRRDGLINPITIYNLAPEYPEVMYCIETGERRWLAYHVLAWLTEEPQWQSIPARMVDAPNVWRQAQENTARSNLNAIGLARQLALLLLDIYMHSPFNLTFQPYETFEHDREFYAQVADGNEYPIPYGDGERFVTAMGVKNRSQLNQYRMILRIPDHIWTKGDEESWGIGSLIGLARESINALIDFPQSDESIIPSSPSTTTDEVEPPTSSTVNDEPAEPTNVQPPMQENMVELKLAYKIGQRSKQGWFAAVAIGTAPHILNNMVNQGYLDCKTPNNGDYRAAVYRINVKGCDVLGLARLEFQDPADNPPAGTPPRHTKRWFNTDDERQFKLMLTFTDLMAEKPGNRAYMLNAMQRCKEIIESVMGAEEQKN